MALSTNRLDEIVEGFIRKLVAEIPVDEVILFGSYAHGRAKEYSDIDLAIISDWFRGRPYKKTCSTSLAVQHLITA